jgi:Plasmid stabilisation system protein.
MKLRFTPRAVQDIAAVADYIRERNPGAAERVRAAILQSLQNLVLFPQVGRAQTVAGVRKRSRGNIPIWSITGLMRRRRKSSSSRSSTPRVSGSMKTPNKA